MALWNRFGALTVFAIVFLFVQLVDQSLARHTFVVAPFSELKPRYRRDISNNSIESTKPEVKSLRVESFIKYRYAHTVVFSKVVNRANESRELGITTVLPDSAFISGFAITINDTVYKAYVKEKEEARRIYQEAVSSGWTAGHVELSARDTNTFTVSVNVEAYGKVSFNLTYEELLTRDLGTYKHKITLNPGQIVKDMHVQVSIQESSNITVLQVPELRESNELEPNDNSENALVTKEQPTANSAIIQWSPTPEQQEEINRDGVKGLLEVRYDVDRVSQPNQILVNEGYFVHYFAPPDLNPLSKHVIFVLDRSGSMYGRKIEQLKEAMGSILDELRAGDSFSIVLFSDSIQLWLSDGRLVDADNHGEPISPLAIASATPENIEAAKTTVRDTDASGGTHIYDALKAALRLVPLAANELNNQSPKEPMIIFLTDGHANGRNSGSDVIISHTTRDNMNPPAVIYGLAFGSDADFSLLKKLSLKNSGFARKIYEASDASLQLKNFYREVSSPLLTDVEFHYLDDQVDVDSLTKIQFRTHNNGSEIVVAGRLANSSDITSTVTGLSVTGNITLNSYPMIEVTDFFPVGQLMQNASQAGFMERLWAYLTIKQLLDLKEQMDNETINDQAMELALAYSFVTPLTSLVVVKPDDSSSAADLQATPVGEESSGMAGRAFLPMSRGPGIRQYSIQAAYPGAFQFEYASSLASIPLDARTSHRRRPKSRGRSRLSARTQTPMDETTPLVQEAVGSIVRLSSFTWFNILSNDTHVTLLVNGVEETLKIGYAETDIDHQACTPSLSGSSHCRHLPYCSLPNFSQSISDYLPYFCKIDSFIGVCCPDAVPKTL